ILYTARALDDVAVLETNLVPWEQAEVLLWGLLAEIVAFDPQLAAEGELSYACFWVVRVKGRLAGFRLTLWVVGDHQFQRVEHSDRARRDRVEVVAQRLF